MTHIPSGRLFELVRTLDALSAAPSLVELAEAIESAQLTLADVADYVQTNPRSYNRALVALRERYELLVMTWLPGQASVPHDHAGSICVMQGLRHRRRRTRGGRPLRRRHLAKALGLGKHGRARAARAGGSCG